MAQAIRNAIRVFIVRQADSHESLDFFDSRASHDFRANRANRFARFAPLGQFVHICGLLGPVV